MTTKKTWGSPALVGAVPQGEAAKAVGGQGDCTLVHWVRGVKQLLQETPKEEEIVARTSETRNCLTAAQFLPRLCRR